MTEMKTLTIGGKTYEIVDAAAREAIGTEREIIRRSCSTAIVNTVEGSPIILDDTSDNQLLGLRMFGKTTQTYTYGRNIFDIETWLNDSGVTWSKSGNNYTITTQVNLYNTPYVFSDTDIDVTFYCKLTNTTTDNTRIELLDSNNAIVGYFYEGYAAQSCKACKLRINWTVTGDVTIAIPQLELGKYPTAYEPYTGGIPSPNPDYPQELKSVGDSGEVKIRSCGKNLFPLKDVEFVRDYRYPLGFDHPAGTYMFSAVITSTDTDDNACAVMFYKGDEWIDSVYMPRTTAGERTSYKKVINRSFDMIRFYAARSYGKSEGDTCNMFDIQLEFGDVATEFEPYKGYDAVVSTPNGLPGIPVDSGGNCVDANGKLWVCDEIDFERRMYIQRVKTKVLDGSITPSTFAAGANGGTVFGWNYDYISMSDVLRERSNKLCDKLLPHDDPAPGSYKECKIGRWGFNTNGSADMFFLMNVGEFETAADAAAWLSENPITVMYILKEPIKTYLTEEQIAEYKNLYTNYPNTTIVNDSGVHMEAKYNVDTVAYINNQIQAAISGLSSGNMPSAEGASF